MKVSFENISISAIQSVIPKNKLNFNSLAPLFGQQEVNKIIRTTGISSVRVAHQNITSSDLCFEAGRLLMERSEICSDLIDGLIFVSQTRDHLLPQTSSILQHKLKLPETCICFDLPIGCSGYIYGLFQASMLISSGACSKVLLLAGDTTTKLVNDRDRASRMVFGDAGTATLIEKGRDEISFNIMNDGSGAFQLIVPAGEFRKPKSNQTCVTKEAEDLNFRSEEDLYMDGMGVFEFAISRVPDLINLFLNDIGWNKTDVDLFLFHQANYFMVDFLRRRLKLEKIHVPIQVDGVGNTGPSSIPLLISLLKDGDSNNQKKDKVIMVGFGVGLSWGSCAASLKPTKIFPIQELN
jgi:3-oxoacyl-[acyl-carrier-protein] synthase-3